jgi:Holliday junction resolvase RusA-like endonuclease
MTKPIIQLHFDCKPVSINSAYMQRGRYRILTVPAKAFKEAVEKEARKQLSKTQIKQLQTMNRLHVEIHMSSNWITKKQTIRKKDIASFEKLLTDSIFTAIGIDDSSIFELVMTKEEDSDEWIKYYISEI